MPKTAETLRSSNLIHVQKSYDGETLVVKDLNLAVGEG